MKYKGQNSSTKFAKPKRQEVDSTMSLYHSASQSREKYLKMAKEAIISGDKILSELYYQYADHFCRVMNEAKYKSQRAKSNTNFKKNTSEATVVDNNEVKVESAASE